MAIDGMTISIGSLLTGVVACFLCMIRHISQRSKHPCSKDLVYDDVCEERGKANEQAHTFLAEKIAAAVTHSDEQHKELKSDMKTGFTEIKTLIQNK
jgi:hypothetical protein